jgi:hypothetical protein
MVMDANTQPAAPSAAPADGGLTLPPTPDDVRRIVAVRDPVIRNLQITQCYFELSRSFAALTGPEGNWCSIATWASKQAGQSIRKEDLARTFERLVRESQRAVQAAQAMSQDAISIQGQPSQSLAGAVGVLRSAISPKAAFKRNSEAVARGNRKVFEEIGFEFARFLAVFPGGRPDEARLAEFLAGLSSGDPPEGQSYLQQAFTHYHRALQSEDPAVRAQLLLLANLEIGFHEQNRLQPEIVEAMNAPIMDPRVLRRRLLEELFPTPESGWRTWLAGLGDRARPVLEARDRLADEARRIGRLAITEQMMTLAMPDGRTLRLGHDLDAILPEMLQHPQLPELVALLARVDPTPDSRTGADDWSVLADRMHFIAALFRAYHFNPVLFNTPFTAEQTAEIRAGRRPEGRL